MADERNPNAIKTLGKSATSITNIVVAGTASVAALALHSWAIVAVGGAAYAALLAWDLTTGGGKRKSGGGAGEAPKLLEPEAYTDQQTQATVRTVLGARREIDRVLAETAPDVRANLAMALMSVAELEEHAAKLAHRGEDIAKYLLTSDPRVVQQDVETLAKRVLATRDPEAKAQYEGARAARAEHLQTLQDLANAKERIGASLLGIAATLEGIPAKIVRMRALDAQAMDELTGDVSEELARMNGEIKMFEETLKHIGEAVA